jgi:hypothetical protein
MDNEIEKVLRIIQTSMHDQISGLKVDTQKAMKDAQAALEICAELEQNVNANTSDKERIKTLSDIVTKIAKTSKEEAENNSFYFSQIRMLSGINYIYCRLSMQILVFFKFCSTQKEIDQCLELLYKLQRLHDSIDEQIYSAMNTDDLQVLGENFIKNIMIIQKESLMINPRNVKLIKGSK